MFHFNWNVMKIYLSIFSSVGFSVHSEASTPAHVFLSQRLETVFDALTHLYKQRARSVAIVTNPERSHPQTSTVFSH